MEFSIEVLKIIFFLIPGIMSMLIIEKLTTHKKISFDRFSTYSIVLSFFIYIFHYLIWRGLFDLIIMLKWHFLNISSPKIILYDFLKNQNIQNLTDITSIMWILLVSILLSIFISYSVNNKFINRLGLFIKTTSKYGDESVWEYFHNMPYNDWVVVRDLKNDLMYYGWIGIFSDDNGIYDELILIDATVYKNSTAEKLYETNKVYISGKREDFRIEIYNNRENKNV